MKNNKVEVPERKKKELKELQKIIKKKFIKNGGLYK